MGTYSKGVLIITKEALVMEELVKQTIPEFLGGLTRKNVEKNAVMFSFESRKMYGSFPHVSAFRNWLDSLDEKCFRYVEVCEDHDEYIMKGDLIGMWPEVYIVFDDEIVV